MNERLLLVFICIPRSVLRLPLIVPLTLQCQAVPPLENVSELTSEFSCFSFHSQGRKRKVRTLNFSPRIGLGRILTTHKIVYKRIDSRICIAQPVWEQREHWDHFTLLEVRRIANDVERVDRKVARGKHYHDGDEHFRGFSSCAQLAHGGWIRLAMTLMVDLICWVLY